MLLTLVPEHERAEVLKFRYFDDKKRALLSRLMQRTACARVANVHQSDVVLSRTKGKKPFFAWREMAVGAGCDQKDTQNPKHQPRQFLPNAPNFNFNVSHEGDFVVLVSEPVAIVGVDVGAARQARRLAGGAPDNGETKIAPQRRTSLNCSKRSGTCFRLMKNNP
jgi:4'-phosphopantetheinyl transferase